MNFYVYEITNNINGKKYIGKRKCYCNIEDDCYMGSGSLLTRAFKKYGISNFSKKIIEICATEKDAYEREKYWINHFKAVESDEYYNLIEGGQDAYVKTTKEMALAASRKKRKSGLYEDEYKRKIEMYNLVRQKEQELRDLGVDENYDDDFFYSNMAHEIFILKYT